IFEAGISQKGEMQALMDIIQPNIGVFTYLGSSHDEGFKNQDEKIAEKTLLFKSCEIVILEKNSIIEKTIHCPKITWSLQDKRASIFAEINGEKQGFTSLKIHYKSETFSLEIPFTDEISIKNCLNCLGVLL